MPGRILGIDITMVIDYGPMMEQISISKFKATCLAVLDRVQTTGVSIQVTRRGQPIAEVRPTVVAGRADWLGCMADTGRVVGDLVAPAVEAHEWEVLRP